MPFQKRVQFLDAELVSCHPSVALHNFLHHGILHPALKGLVVLLRRNRIGSCYQEDCGDLPCFLTGEEQEPQSNSNKDFQHDINSFSLTIRVMVASARPVCSLIDL